MKLPHNFGYFLSINIDFKTVRANLEDGVQARATSPSLIAWIVVSSKNSVCDYSFQNRADPDEHKATIFAAEPRKCWIIQFCFAGQEAGFRNG
ncbi:hypothetical protein ABKV19_027027 [Rosa sericea]